MLSRLSHRPSPDCPVQENIDLLLGQLQEGYSRSGTTRSHTSRSRRWLSGKQEFRPVQRTTRTSMPPPKLCLNTCRAPRLQLQYPLLRFVQIPSVSSLVLILLQVWQDHNGLKLISIIVTLIRVIPDHSTVSSLTVTSLKCGYSIDGDELDGDEF